MSILSWVGRSIGLTDGKFWSWWYGGNSSTGKVVTPQSALTVATAWACTRLLSQSAEILPFSVFQKLPDGGARELPGHPAYALIHDQPNAEATAAEFWGNVVAWMVLDGNAYGYKRRMPDGRVVATELIPSNAMDVGRFSNGRLRYRFTWQGRQIDVTADEVVHFRSFSLGGDKGLSAISYGTNSLGVAMAADDSAGRMFSNGSTSPGFIQSPGVMSKEQREQFRVSMEGFRASESANKLFLLEGGFEFKPMGINPDDMQMLASRAWSVEDVCRWFGVPPFMVGHTEKVTSFGSGLEQQILGYLQFSLLPILRKIETRADLAFLSAGDRARGIYTRFNVEGMMRADSAGRAALWTAMLRNGVYTRNEVRAKENLSRIDGGDIATVESNLVPLDRLGDVGAANGDANAARAALQQFLQIPPKPPESTSPPAR